MLKVRKSNLMLAALFALLLGVLLWYSDTLQDAHTNGDIDYFAADAMTYFSAYQLLFAEAEISENPALFLVGSPILLLTLTGGELLLIQLGQLALMGLSLWAGAKCFATLRGKVAFFAGSLAFPYFLFGFLSVNKEVFAMCSAIFYATWFVRGQWRYLVLALLLAMCARYYMLVAMLALLVLVPRGRPPRTALIAAMLIAISLGAPFIKMLVPAYSPEGLLEAPGLSSFLFAKAIDSFAYALVYPFKYLLLIPTRAYSLLIDPTRLANGMEGIVSLASLLMVAAALYIVLLKKPTSDLVRRLIVMAFVAPMPIMWTEIMHWRYFSFVYFFYLFGVVLHFIERPRQAAPTLHGVLHA